VRSSERTWPAQPQAVEILKAERDDQQVVVPFGGMEQRFLRIGLHGPRRAPEASTVAMRSNDERRSSTIRIAAGPPVVEDRRVIGSWNADLLGRDPLACATRP